MSLKAFLPGWPASRRVADPSGRQCVGARTSALVACVSAVMLGVPTVVLAPSASAQTVASQSVTYTCMGTGFQDQAFSVPEGVTTVQFEAEGGAGGSGSGGSGGLGGGLVGTISVTPGEMLTVVVGCNGTATAGSAYSGSNGTGWADGGPPGGGNLNTGGGGGGATAILQGARALVVAGGGGGGGAYGIFNAGSGYDGGNGGGWATQAGSGGSGPGAGGGGSGYTSTSTGAGGGGGSWGGGGGGGGGGGYLGGNGGGGGGLGGGGGGGGAEGEDYIDSPIVVPTPYLPSPWPYGYVTLTVDNAPAGSVPQYYQCSGEQADYTVPPGATGLQVVAIGATGGPGYATQVGTSTQASGGSGDGLSSTLQVAPGDYFNLAVGCAGTGGSWGGYSDTSNPGASPNAYGYTLGGLGGAGEKDAGTFSGYGGAGGGGGGGSTGISIGSAVELLAAGGGGAGGGGDDTLVGCGGAGGGGGNASGPGTTGSSGGNGGTGCDAIGSAPSGGGLGADSTDGGWGGTGSSAGYYGNLAGGGGGGGGGYFGQGGAGGGTEGQSGLGDGGGGGGGGASYTGGSLVEQPTVQDFDPSGWYTVGSGQDQGNGLLGDCSFYVLGLPTPPVECGTPSTSNGNGLVIITPIFASPQDLTVSATVTTSFTRAFNWQVTKKVNVGSQDIAAGQAHATFQYTVGVSHDKGVDSDWQVSGDVTVTNPNSFAVSGISVSAQTTNGGTCAVNGGTGLTIEANTYTVVGYTCAYSSAPSAASGKITAQASWTSYGSPHTAASGTYLFDFATPTTVVNGTVTVTDSLAGVLGQVNYTQSSPTNFKYLYSFSGVSGECVNENNVASLKPGPGSANAQVQVCKQAQTTLTWATPASITYGTQLNGLQLNATASAVVNGNEEPVQGTYTYTVVNPNERANGAVLPAGRYKVEVTFTPQNTTLFSTPQAVFVFITVNPAPLVIQADHETMTYGGTVPAFAVSYQGFVNGDNSSVVSALKCTSDGPGGTPVTSATPVGSYTITCSGAQAANYTITYKTSTLTISPAPLTITANNQTMAAGGTVPAFMASYNGFVNGQDSSIVTGLTCGADDSDGNPVTSATPPGTYQINCSGASAPNYSVTYVPGTLTIGAASVPTWSAGPTGPPARSAMAMATDPSGETLLFGGASTGYSYLSDTWVLSSPGGTWAELDISGPSARAGAAMVWDPDLSEFVLFGGVNSSGYLNDTWAFNPATSTWAELAPTASPTPRTMGAVAAEPDGDIVLFGGVTYTGYLNDTWVYDASANTWSQAQPSQGPSARYSASMAASSGGTVVLFGGAGTNGYDGDTWSYDLSSGNWTELSPTGTVPSARAGAAFAFDSSSGDFVLFGGESASAYNDDTYTYDPSTGTWAALSPTSSPPVMDEPGFSYDQTANTFILFGGWDGTNYLASTWEFPG